MARGAMKIPLSIARAEEILAASPFDYSAAMTDEEQAAVQQCVSNDASFEEIIIYCAMSDLGR